MNATTTFQKRMLSVPGGSLYYEVRGAGPVLLMMPGGPADATTFRRIEDRLAADYTVVTYDPRGLSHSSAFDPKDDPRMVEMFADDAHRLIAEVGDGGKASIFASSGGAVIAIELIKQHGGELDTVVLHEPPAPDLLSDSAATRAGMFEVCDTCAAQGVWPAAAKFMKLVGIEGGPPPASDAEPTPEQLEAQAMMQRNFEFFFGRYIRNIAAYPVDVDALKACSCRIVAAAGVDSAGQLAHRGALGLATALGIEPTFFPGDHGGFDGRAEEFGPRLLEVLEG